MQATTVTCNAAGGKPDEAKACFQSDRLHFVFEMEQITSFLLDWHNVSYKSCSALTAHVGHAPPEALPGFTSALTRQNK